MDTNAHSEKLQQKLAEHRQLEIELAEFDYSSNINGQHITNSYPDLVRKYGELSKIAKLNRQLTRIDEELGQLVELLVSNDNEERQFAETEQADWSSQKTAIKQQLVALLREKATAIRDRCVIEIRAGAGGDEAGLFAGELFTMYRQFSELRKWKFEVLEANPMKQGGFRSVTIAVHGTRAFDALQSESGGHRVQRVPATETKGRMHSSLVTVAVMPEPTEVEIRLTADDYRCERFRASSPGGQKVNKVETAVRLTHYETRIVVSMQDESSQHKNLSKALRILRSRVFEYYSKIKLAERDQQRRDQIGSGDRSQRIRTYNFPENRVTDHRTKVTVFGLDRILRGELDGLLG